MTSLEKLKNLLSELFQLDQAELDFGIYRIMNAKREEITRFLDRDLLPQVREVLSTYERESRASLEAELEKAKEQAKTLGFDDPTQAPKVKELQARYNAAFDVEAAEQEVFSHLYNFFRRYYSEGDFISQRRYKEGVYAIPYEGEEVKLYWANHDQYYIKTSEYLRNYTFKLPSGKRVHFKLVEADTEKDNNRPANGNERRFLLGRGDKATWGQGDKATGGQGDVWDLVDDELVIYFRYVPDPQKRKQADLNAEACERLTALIAQSPLLQVSWSPLLEKRPTEKNPNRTLLEKHLTDYTARNTFDYFIHKDLGSFLRRELDFYIKNEVMHLDDIESETAPRVEQYLSKIKAIRRIAHKIIDFLAQIENFQKKLWLKKKFVVEAQYCITLDRIFTIKDEETRNWLIGEIIQNDAQREEWVRLFAIDEIKGDLTTPGYSTPLKKEFLKAHPTLVVDTRHFTAEFTLRLLATSEHLDEDLDGILIWSDNYHGLNLLLPKYSAAVRCIYIDPPFNTDTDAFAYKDRYRHSSWMAMMADRLAVAKALLCEDGTFYCHIDYNEKERLKLLLDEHLEYITEIIWRIGWVSGYKSAANKFIRNHDTIYQYGKTDTPLFIKSYIPYPEGYTRRDGSPPSGQGYPLEDTWNCSELDQLHSIQIMSFSREKVGSKALTQKNENLLARMIRSSSNEGDLILDYFLGSGTTTAVAQKLRRQWIGIEMDDCMLEYAIPRMKRVLAGDPYGVSSEVDWKGGGFFKYIRLESYEDTLNNLEVKRTEAQQRLLEEHEDFREDYMLRYMLDVESRGSASLLNIDRFEDPFNYKLDIATGTAGETKPTVVDLVETFNYLIGLRVKTIDHIGGVRVVTGTNPQGERVLILWRNAREIDNDKLDEWFKKQGYNTKDQEYDVIYVNGDNNLENLRKTDQTWKVRLIEEEFKRLMFDVQDV